MRALLTLLLLLAACVDFDAQSVRWRYDAAKDRLDALIVYRGLYVEGDGREKALEQLERIRGGARWFALLSNWPFNFNLEAKECDAGIIQRAEAPLAARIAPHVTVRNGPLWLDAQGRLCASQLVRVEQLSNALAAINEAFVALLGADPDLDEFSHDEATKDLLRKAAVAKRAFFGVRGSAFTFTLPITDEGFRHAKSTMLEALRRKDNGDFQQFLGMLAATDWSVERSGDDLTFTLGNPGRGTCAIEVPARGEYKPGLADLLTQKGWVIEQADGEADALRSFEAQAGE
ncbi:MAG: hypothetical protein ACREID_06910 [Planctomycetota bacterium]